MTLIGKICIVLILVMSIAFMLQRKTDAIIWRGPRKNGLITQFVTDVEWNALDVLLVDCPPRMDAWGWAGLRLCDQVLMPVQAEFFSMHGLSNMLETLREARSKHPGKADLMGVLVTMLDAEEAVAREILEDLRDNLGDHLINTVIFRDAALVEAASHGRTVFDYRLCSKGARSYGELVREVLNG